METKDMNEERLAFEKWLDDTCCYADFALDADGDYDSKMTLWAWKGWQAAKGRYAAPRLRLVRTRSWSGK